MANSSGAAPGQIGTRYIEALRAGGLTNPFGLGAVGAYGQRESRYSPRNITGSWSDPSESGEAGTSGGIMSWRGPRLAAMREFTAGAADPVAAQASFMLAENPRLTSALQNAGSPEEAHRLMADAWKFAGYNRSGGEAAERLAATRSYANLLANGQMPDTSVGTRSNSPAPIDPSASSATPAAPSGAFSMAGPAQTRSPPFDPLTGQAVGPAPAAAESPSGTDSTISAIASLLGGGKSEGGEGGQDQGGGSMFAAPAPPRPRPFGMAMMRLGR